MVRRSRRISLSSLRVSRHTRPGADRLTTPPSAEWSFTTPYSHSLLGFGEHQEHVDEAVALRLLPELVQVPLGDEPALVQQAEAGAESLGVVEVVRRQDDRL